MAKQRKKKKQDRSDIECKLGRAVHLAGHLELLTGTSGDALDAVAHDEILAHNSAVKNLNTAREKIVEINNELSALDK